MGPTLILIVSMFYKKNEQVSLPFSHTFLCDTDAHDFTGHPYLLVLPDGKV